MTTTRNFTDEARQDAREMCLYFLSDILDMIENMEEGDTEILSTDLFNDWSGGDEYHHENHIGWKEYTLLEAATLLDDLSDHIETDNGLWEGLEPRKAISAQAAWTYGNAVYVFWQQIIEAINTDIDEGIIHDALIDNQDIQVIENMVRDIIRDYR
jgi:hypothetical protein